MILWTDSKQQQLTISSNSTTTIIIITANGMDRSHLALNITSWLFFYLSLVFFAFLLNAAFDIYELVPLLEWNYKRCCQCSSSLGHHSLSCDGYWLLSLYAHIFSLSRLIAILGIPTSNSNCNCCAHFLDFSIFWTVFFIIVWLSAKHLPLFHECLLRS